VTTDFSLPISPPTGNQDRATSACEPYRELIEQGLCRGRNGKAIWQGLVSDHGFSGSYQTVKRFARKLHGTALPEAVGIIQTVAGEEAQVDYGSGPMVRDPLSGKYRRTGLFVLTLGCSRKSVRLLLFRKGLKFPGEPTFIAMVIAIGRPCIIVNHMLGFAGRLQQLAVR
jgi:transposase